MKGNERMKKYFKLLAALLAILMLASAFVACNFSGDEIEDGEEESSTPPEVIPPTVEKNNYNAEFYLSILPDTNSMNYFWVEESTGDAMSESIYTRQVKVKDHLGVTVLGKSAGNYQTYISTFKADVDANTGAVHTLLTHVNTGVNSLITEGYLRDFQDQERINLEEDYWNHDFMDALSIADHYYLGFSDFNILYTYVITFNKKMLNQLNFIDQGYTEKDLYASVRNGTWTVDRFLELATIGHHYDGKGQEVVGLVGQQWVPWIGFMQASGINLVEQNDEGQYTISFFNDYNKEKTANLVEMFKEYSESGKGDLTYPSAGVSGVPQPEHKFTESRALMQLTSTYSLPSITQSSDVSFGILPYPLYDSDQFDPDEENESHGYRSLQWGGYLTIPVRLNGADAMVCDTLETLSYYSDPVKFTFYEKLLGKQAAEAPDDRDMLDIVWASVCTDFGQTFSEACGGTLYVFPQVTREESGKNLASTHDSIKRSGDKKIKQFIAQVEKVSSK
jgi:ABC-type glycerol-3-phosphate transport system substrate-binding protein